MAEDEQHVTGSSGATYERKREHHDGQSFGSNYTDSLGLQGEAGNEMNIRPPRPHADVLSASMKPGDAMQTDGRVTAVQKGERTYFVEHTEDGPKILYSQGPTT